MIKAEFKSYGSYTTDSVSQWDLNQKLTINGLDINVAPVLAFSCFGMYESIIVQSKLSNGVIICNVPNAILQFGKNLNVDLCSETGGQYKAFEKMIIPVNRRKKPSDYLFTDNVPLSTTESIKADLEEKINSNKTYMDKVKTELKNDNKTLNGRIDTILTGTANTTKLVTVHSATIRNNSASDLTFKISSKDNETLKSIKDKSPTVINANVIAKALDGVAINGKGIPSSYNVESTNDEYVITVYSGSSSVVGQYVFMAVVTIAYEDIATDISSAELKDVRAGADGTVYKSAGEAVRQQIGSLKESLKDINVETDKTLTQSGKPADAEVVGKNLDDLKKNNDNLVENVPTGTCTDVIVMDLTDKSNYIQGKFVNDIPTPDTSGNEYFTDYIDCTTDDFLRIPDIVVTGATAYRLFDDSKAFLGLYCGVPRDVLKTAVKTKNENAKYIVISYDTRITTGHLTKTVYETYGKSKIAGKEFDHYGVQNTRISFVVSHNGEVSKKYSCVPGETYTFRARSNCNVYFYNPAKVFVESKSIFSSNNIEVAIEVTAPETAVYFALGGQNTTSCSLEGNFLVERCTVPKLQLTKNNFNQESFEAIAEGLGISSGKDPTELYYNCTNYGVVPGSSDNTAKFQELVDLVYEAGGGTIWIPCGTYVFDTKLSSVDLTGNITTLVEMKSGVSLLGESLTGTVLKVIGQTKDGCGLFCQNSVHSGEVLSGCNAQNFTVDMSEASLTNYTHRGKAFYYSGIKNSVFRDLRLLETPSTSMGIDMLDNVVLDSIYVYKGGKQWTYGGNGGAGIGIGTGKWKNENYIIRNCICDSCGHFGIFLEDQGIFSSAKDRTYSKGQIICNNVVRNGRHYGLGIRGGQNVLITGNNLYENKGGIYADYGAKNVMVSNNLIQGSTEAGFNYGNESTDYACENMAIINNTFLDNSVGIKKTLTPTNCTENGNVFINNTTNTQ